VTLKIGSPGIHRGKSLRLYIRGNEETTHGSRDVSFMSTLAYSRFGKLEVVTFGPMAVMLQAFNEPPTQHRPE
jgi:hypothetical protein